MSVSPDIQINPPPFFFFYVLLSIPDALPWHSRSAFHRETYQRYASESIKSSVNASFVKRLNNDVLSLLPKKNVWDFQVTFLNIGMKKKATLI